MGIRSKWRDEAFDVVVVGGGMTGLCAALASAREGARTALVQDRSVLGGNASSEIRMHICGADANQFKRNAAETGIIHEIMHMLYLFRIFNFQFKNFFVIFV